MNGAEGDAPDFENGREVAGRPSATAEQGSKEDRTVRAAAEAKAYRSRPLSSGCAAVFLSPDGWAPGLGFSGRRLARERERRSRAGRPSDLRVH